MLNAFPTSATLLPSPNRACALAFTSAVSTTPDRRRRGAKNPAAPFCRYNFTYRFTVASGTPNARDFTVPHAPIGDHLTGKEPKAGQIPALVLKHRQQPVHVDHLAQFTAHRYLLVDRGHIGGKNWKL
jgi:hypothetical protein